MNHINEHLGMEYRKQIELQLGFNLPPQEDESGEEININPEVEARLAPMLAQAAQRLLQQNQAETAQQAAQQAQQDPIVQMQQQELQIKMAEQQRKAQKDQVDAQLKAQQQQIETGRILAQTELEREKMAANQKMEAVRVATEMSDGRERETIKIGVDLMKQLSSQAHQKEIQKKGNE